jgi:hypothetical protein
MINIFYRDSHLQARMSGPKKVIENLFRSLDDCGVDYAVNREIHSHNLFLHWDEHHIELYGGLRNKKTLLVGPQIWPYSGDSVSKLVEYGKIIVPGWWVKKSYDTSFPSLKTLMWPVGIYAPEIYNDHTIDCLIYYKNRPAEDLEYVKSMLSNRRLTHIQLEYGSYTQQNFKDALSSVKFCIIVDNTESQGIAIQEMMSVNKPLFVWDQPVWDHMGEQYTVPASSVPYWSSECGEKVVNKEDLELTLDAFILNFKNYCPRDYVNRELSPQKSVQILLNHYSGT